MSVNLRIAAEVVDIRGDTPVSSDSFLVDTNVWYWLTYTRAGLLPAGPAPYQLSDYPAFVSKALRAKSRLCWTGYSYGELAHLIERTEYDIFSLKGGKTSRKEFRHNFVSERARVVGEMEAAWSQVETIGAGINCTLDGAAIGSARARIRSSSVDPYDALALDAASSESVQQVLSDDGDFATVPGFRVFTANNRVLKLAQAAGRLIRR